MMAANVAPRQSALPWRRSARIAAAPFLATRALVLAAGLIATLAIGFDPLPTEQAAWRVSGNALANLPARWDAYWYLDIARHGYRWDPASIQQQNVVFFPAYPLLLRGAGWLANGAVLWAGAGMSLLAFAWALAVFARLATREIGEQRARTAAWLLAAYPFGVFFGAPYTESLYLLAFVSVWLACREHRWRAAAAWGLLLGLTRPNGFVMSVPIAFLVLAETRARPGGLREWLRHWRTPQLLVAVAPVAGMLAYSAWLGSLTGEPFAWFKGQAAWGLPSSGLATPVDPRWGPPLPWRWSDIIVHAGNTAAVILALASLVPIHRRLGPAPALVVLLSVVPPLATHGILSMGRFTAVLFPLFLWLATAIPPERRRSWVWGLLGGQVVAAALFYTWRILV